MMTRDLKAAFFVLPLLCSHFVAANGSEESTRFLEIPNAQSPCPFKGRSEFAIGLLPSEVSDQLYESYYAADGIASTPIVFRGFALDLNNDQGTEYFLQTPLGGSGGPHYTVFSERQAGWSEIFNFQGESCLIPSETAWYQIVTIYRGGAEIYAKSLFRFLDGRYHLVAQQWFDHGKITKTPKEANQRNSADHL